MQHTNSFFNPLSLSLVDIFDCDVSTEWHLLPEFLAEIDQQFHFSSFLTRITDSLVCERECFSDPFFRKIGR